MGTGSVRHGNVTDKVTLKAQVQSIPTASIMIYRCSCNNNDDYIVKLYLFTHSSISTASVRCYYTWVF